MTREEAIAVLEAIRQYIIAHYLFTLTEEDNEAIDMAISALSIPIMEYPQVDGITPHLIDEPSDLISRAEAIDAVCQGCAWYNTASCENSREWKCDEIIRIMDLPSVSVESKATENKYDCDLISRIVRCKDCEYYDNGENEVDSWEMCKRNLHSTSQYDFCSWAKMKGGTK